MASSVQARWSKPDALPAGLSTGAARDQAPASWQTVALRHRSIRLEMVLAVAIVAVAAIWRVLPNPGAPGSE